MKLDVVLQFVGQHSWNVGGGWVNAAKRLGVLNRVFRPSEEADDGLWEYLPKCESDFILLCGFDWHSRPLHKPEAWKACRAKKIIYCQESIVGFGQLTGTDRMYQAAKSANECADFWVYTDIADGEVIRSFGKPCLWQPFGVDLDVFKPVTPFGQRSNMPFFRGKVEFEFDRSDGQGDNIPVYGKRRELVKLLESKGLLHVQRFDFKPLPAEKLVSQYNDHQIVVNFPSVFPGHPTRVTEAMACGCAMVTNRTGIRPLDDQFDEPRHLWYYDTDASLVDAVKWCMDHPSLSADMAEEGCKHVHEYFALHKLLENILRKVQKS